MTAPDLGECNHCGLIFCACPDADWTGTNPFRDVQPPAVAETGEARVAPSRKYDVPSRNLAAVPIRKDGKRLAGRTSHPEPR